jgi:hypothetical protein
MKKLITLFLSASFLFSAAYSKDIEVKPSAIYKNIDVQLMNDTVKSLQKARGKSRDELIKKISDSPENYAPPVFYLLSSAFFREDKKDEAMFWFYAGQLRGRIDANICADKSAGSAIDVLNEKFGPEINQYAFKDIPKLTNTVERVLAWEEKTGCNYDRRWINLEGMNVFSGDSSSPLSAPKEQWEAIRKKTRDDYRSSFYEALKTLN